MQFLIMLFAALALASATPGHLGGYTVSLLDPVGDTAEVAVAKANHFQAHANAKAGLVGHGIIAHGVYGIATYGVPSIHGGYASNIITPSGDTIEVAAAKAAHLHAHAKATAGHLIDAYGVNTYGVYGAPVYHGGYASNIITPSGDTIEVAAAKAAHLQAHANVKAGHGVAGYGINTYGLYGAHGHHGGYASNILTPSGDTIEVAAAKASHLHAHAKATAGHLIDAYGVNTYGVYGVPVYHGGYASGILTSSGDTIDVAAAKAAHLQAHANVKSGLADAGTVVYSAPLSIATPAVAAYAAPVAHAVVSGSTQYHAQDTLGQYSYGYSDSNSAKHETRALDGTTHGGYSYVDGHGVVQSVKYHADALGFRAHGTNFPVAG